MVDNAVSPEDFVATITRKEFDHGSIVFTLDRKLPSDWFQIISGAHFGSYSALMGYEPDTLRMKGESSVSMRLRGNEGETTIRSIVENVTDWVSKTNSAYTARLKRVALQEQREKEKARKAEIEKMERESKLAAIIANL